MRRITNEGDVAGEEVVAAVIRAAEEEGEEARTSRVVGIRMLRGRGDTIRRCRRLLGGRETTLLFGRLLLL